MIRFIKIILSLFFAVIAMGFLTGVFALSSITILGSIICGILTLTGFFIAYKIYPKAEKVNEKNRKEKNDTTNKTKANIQPKRPSNNKKIEPQPTNVPKIDQKYHYELFNTKDEKKEILGKEEVVINFGKYKPRPTHILHDEITINDGNKETHFKVSDIVSYSFVDTNFCDCCVEIKFKPDLNSPITYFAKLFYDDDEWPLVGEIIKYINVNNKNI